MKRIYIIFCLSILTFFKGQEIDGIGIFKLETFTIQDLENFSKKNNVVLVEELERRTENIKVFNTNNFNLLDRYLVEKIQFNFFKNKLSNIYMKNPAPTLYMDFNTKYKKDYSGKDKEKGDKCYIEDTPFLTYKEKYRVSWKNREKDFGALYVITEYQDKDCKHKTDSELFIYDNKVSDAIFEESQKHRKKIEEEKRQEKIKSLEDL